MNRKRRIRRRIVVSALVLLLVSLAAWLPLRVFPYIREVAENQVVNAVSGAITDAVTEQLRFGTVDYSKVIILERDISGILPERHPYEMEKLPARKGVEW